MSSHHRCRRAAGILIAALTAVTAPGAVPAGARPAAVVAAQDPPAATLAPDAARQTAAGRVTVSGPVTGGATSLRLLEDGAVVAEVRVSGRGVRAFTRTGVAVGSHTYAFQAGNGGGWGPVSSTVSVTVVDVPGAMGTVTLTQTATVVVQVSFAAVSGAAGYAVFADGRRRATIAAGDGGTVTGALRGLPVDVAASVTVMAYNVAGFGAASTAVPITPRVKLKKSNAPSTAAGTRQTSATDAVVVAKPTLGATAYTLSIDGAASGLTPVVTPTAVTFTVTGLAAGDHELAVTASNPTFTATASKPLAFTMLPAPGAAAVVSVTQRSDTEVRVVYTPGASGTQHVIQVDGTTYATQNTRVGATTGALTVKALAPLSSHTVRVVASNPAGTAAPSAAQAFTLYPTLGGTTGTPVATQTGATTARVTITTTPNAVDYVLRQDGSDVATATASGGTVTFDVTGLTPGASYAFTVAARNPRTTAAASNPATLLVSA